jgi:sugar lactone lactonase YvrE
MARANYLAAVGLLGLMVIDARCEPVAEVAFHPGMISAFAGSGTAGYTGDQGPALSGTFRDPSAIAIGSQAIYVADTSNHAVRRISLKDLTISTVAGTGNSGYSGDGGPASSATLSFPAGVAVDSSGNLFISDTGNNVVRKVDLSGIITTVVGTNSIGIARDPINVGDGGDARVAVLWHPSAISFDRQGHLFIADTYNNRVRKFDTEMNVITTIAGNGSAGYSGDGAIATTASLLFPCALAIDQAGNIAIADASNVIRWIDSNTGHISTIAGGGINPGTDLLGDGGPSMGASLLNPMGLSFDANGTTLFVSDSYHGLIRAIDTTTWHISLIAGMTIERQALASLGVPSSANSSPIDTSISVPAGIVADPTSGMVYFVDCGADVLWSVSFMTGSARLYVQQPGGTTTQDVALTNLGTAISNMSFAIIGNTDFSASGGTCTSQLAQGGTCQLTVSFTSHEGQNASAVLLVLDRDADFTPVVLGKISLSGQSAWAQTSECTYTLGSPSDLLPAGGAAGVSIPVTTSSSCGWSSDTDSPWIMITNTKAGTGPATISYTVGPNPTSSIRDGKLYIAGQSLSIVQLGNSVITNSPVDLPSATCSQKRESYARANGLVRRFIMEGACSR